MEADCWIFDLSRFAFGIFPGIQHNQVDHHLRLLQQPCHPDDRVPRIHVEAGATCRPHRHPDGVHVTQLSALSLCTDRLGRVDGTSRGMWPLVKLYLAKKVLTFVAASAYGFKRLYRRSLELNNAVVRNPSANAIVRKGLRHSFDAIVKVARLLDVRGWARRHADGGHREGR